MDAIFSGQAGTLAFVEGASVRVVRASVPDKEIEIAREGLSYLFEGCNDLTIYKSAKSEKAKSEFKISWESDRALRLVLILLDPEEPADVRVEAAICAEGLFSTERVILAVANQLYSRPLPVYADLEVATQGTDWPKLKKLIVEIFERQSLISIQRATWDSLSNKLFEDDDRIYFEEAAIRFGAFRILSMVDPQSDKRNFAIMECHKILASLPNARTIVTEWTKNLRKPGTKLLVAPEEPIDIKVKPIKIHDEYEHSRHQRKAISDLLRRGNILTARRFTDQLIDVQLRSGSDLYAAKSLCDLAQAAKSVGLSSLQLEWAQRATNISPLDAWAHGQAADALSGFYRFDEALEEYALCEKLGDAHFAAMGRARILRLQGRLDDALKAFREAQSNFQGHEHEWFSWAGSAETLRDMWKFKDSLAEYDRAVEKFPDISVLLCGRASVLTDLGQLDEALSVYKRITAKQDDLVALNGIAAVLKQKGELSGALEAASEAIAKYPTDPSSQCNQADILRLSGDLKTALQVYARIKSDYPSLSVAYSGYAEVLRDMRRLPEAIEAYEIAVKKFPLDLHLANGYANARKINNQYKEALRLYDHNSRMFPYSLFAKNGRADLLKRLGEYDEALKAYDQIIETWPDYPSARHAKAAVLVALKRFDEAKALLPNGIPATRDEWIAWHVRGMIMLRQDQLDDAIHHFKFGLKTPFYRERRYFEGALCLAEMQCGHFASAVQTIERSTEVLSNVLYFHALLGSGDVLNARKVYQDISNHGPAQIIDLKEEIAARYRLIERPAHHNDNWIFEKEAEALLREAA